MELALDRQDMYRILACLAHTAGYLEDEAARHRSVAAVMLGQPLGLLGALASCAVAETCGTEAQQLHALLARLSSAAGLGIRPDPVGSPFASV